MNQKSSVESVEIANVGLRSRTQLYDAVRAKTRLGYFGDLRDYQIESWMKIVLIIKMNIQANQSGQKLI